MALFTKSIQLTKKKSDGIRVCIMRRPPKESAFDLWMPVLSPSNKILTLRHQGKMTFEEHKQWFTVNVLTKKEYLVFVADMSRAHDITLLCWELDPNTCHRKWVADEISKLFPDLDVQIG